MNNSISEESPRQNCQGCEALQPVNDLGLCDVCVEKLERDLIRARDWEYSVMSFGMTREDRETMRDEIIASHGEKMELIAVEPQRKKGRSKKPTRSKRKR